jgi:hypothetical protein
MLKIVFLVLAAISFLWKAFGLPSGRVDTVALGFAFVVISFLV